MKNIKVSIRPTEVKTLIYDNQFKLSNGEKAQLAVKTNAAVKLNPQTPTTAVVAVKFEAVKADETLKFMLETVTAVEVDTFVDNLDEFVKKHYLTCIMIAVNEKIRNLTSSLGMNMVVPAVMMENNEDGPTQVLKPVQADNIVNFDANKK